MVTLAQLDAEPYWDREVVTPELSALGVELRQRTGRPATAFGAKGNTSHLRGGHRSGEWIAKSIYCTSRTYTAQSGLTAEQLRHIAACDWTPGDWGTAANRALMVAITKRLLAAMRAGQLAGVREVIGTLDGKTVHAERYDGTRFSADDSHLDHVHLTFDRRRMRDAALMARVADLITGEDMSFLDEPQQVSGGRTGAQMITDLWYATFKGNPLAVEQASLKRVEALLAETLAAAKDDGDVTVQLGPEALAKLEEVRAALAAVPQETADLVHADLAD